MTLSRAAAELADVAARMDEAAWSRRRRPSPTHVA